MDGALAIAIVLAVIVIAAFYGPRLFRSIRYGQHLPTQSKVFDEPAAEAHATAQRARYGIQSQLSEGDLVFLLRVAYAYAGFGVHGVRDDVAARLRDDNLIGWRKRLEFEGDMERLLNISTLHNGRGQGIRSLTGTSAEEWVQNDRVVAYLMSEALRLHVFYTQILRPIIGSLYAGDDEVFNRIA